MKRLSEHLENIKKTDDSELYQKSVIAINSIRGEHSEDINIINEINAEYSKEEIELAFNPSILSVNEQSNLSEESKVRMVKILASYYDIDLPKKISPMDLKDKYEVVTSAYRIDRNTKESSSAVALSNSDDEENDYSLLENLIGEQKSKFFDENVELTAQAIGFNYHELLILCKSKAKNEAQMEKCDDFFEKLFNNLLTFIKFEFSKMNENLQWYYHMSYEKALPIKHAMTYFSSLDLFDEILLELNPVEYKKILIALEDIRKMDDELSNYPSWYAHYQKVQRDSKMIE